MLKPKVSQKKQSWIKGRDVALQGNKLSYNASVQAKYSSQLKALVRKMSDETLKRFSALFQGKDAKKYFHQQKKIAVMDDTIYNQSKKLLKELSDKFTMIFNNKAKPLTQSMIKNSDKASVTSLGSSLKKLTDFTIDVDFIPQGLIQVTNASIAENVSLIKSIPDKYFSDVTGAVMRSITTGNGLSDLVPEIKKYSLQTDRRAKNIARDQSRKAYNNINKQRMMAVGYKKFKWLHSGGGQYPRRSHEAMSGNIYSFDDLPIINKEQVDRGYEAPEIGIPGQAPNCGCTMTPVYEFDDGSTS